MKKVILLVAVAAVLAMSGCGYKQVDWIFTQELIFYNRTGVTVKLESYDGDELKALWTIEPEQLTMIQTWTSDNGGGWGEVTIRSYEKVRIVFGGTKELWSDRLKLNTPYNLYNPDNCTIIKYSHTHSQYVYEIDEAMMNAATAIEAAE